MNTAKRVPELTMEDRLTVRNDHIDYLTARVAELEAALRAIVQITDGSQPLDYPGALMVARAALAKM